MVKPRENRVPIMMSDEELRAIDDWRFANRIATRSDAIRRLCQIGLLVGPDLDGLSGATLEISTAMRQLDEQTYDLWTRILTPVWKGETLNRAAVADLFKSLSANVSQIDAAADDVSSILVGLYRAAAGITRAGDIVEGKEISDKIIEETNADLAKARELRARGEQNRRHLAEIDFSDSWKSKSDEEDGK
ncbi:hypothetical protein HJB77_03225 [Rhizobium lentis]|uniref:hypothetical protein n=1 Tax=Rhizobium lentis TaxID=1138194 RepID=UPI001C83FE0E|nr:hypothetical protein [Rhizobium lentis]MBX5175308.1 hypothetical protein [Rhizobium lentis]